MIESFLYILKSTLVPSTKLNGDFSISSQLSCKSASSQVLVSAWLDELAPVLLLKPLVDAPEAPPGAPAEEDFAGEVPLSLSHFILAFCQLAKPWLKLELRASFVSCGSLPFGSSLGVSFSK